MIDDHTLMLKRNMCIIQAEHMLRSLQRPVSVEVHGRVKDEIHQQLDTAIQINNELLKRERGRTLVNKAMAEAMRNDPSKGVPERYCTFGGATSLQARA